MKTFKIPFTNFVLNLQPVKQGSGRPLTVGQNSGLYSIRDMTGYKLSYESLFHAYRNQSDIFSCIREWRENVGLAGYRFVNPLDRTKPVNEGDAKELDSILNYWQPWRALKSRIVRDFGVAGNAYCAITRNEAKNAVVGLQSLDPRTMALVSDKNGNVLKYIQRVGQNVVEFQPEEIIHFKIDTDPNHELFGFSPMETVIWEARTDLSAMMANYFFFENDAQPAVQYILEPNLSDEEKESARKFIEDQFKGVKNRNRSGILDGVKEVKTFNISQKDMEFLQGRRFTTEKICAAYGVPKFMLGYTDTVNNNNGTELKAKFYESTIQPLEEMMAEVMNEFLERIGLAERIKFEFMPQTFIEQQSLEDRGLKLYQNGAMTLRQLKNMLNMEVTPEDEANPNFDQYILQSGASATLLSDVGVDPLIQDGNAAMAQNLLQELKKLKYEQPSR